MSLVSTSTYTPSHQGSLLFSLRFLGYLIFAVALLVMLGWLMNIHSLTTLSPDFPSMKFNTALAFAISGIGILLGQAARKRYGLQISGLIVVLLMGASLLQYLLNINLGIDELFWPDDYSDSLPGRPSPATCILFILSGALMMCSQQVSDRCIWVIRCIFGVGLFISLAALVTYLLDARSLLKVQFFSSIAVHTAVLFFIQFLANALLINKKNSEFHKETLPGWRQINRLLLPVVVVPLVFGILLFHVVNSQYLSVGLGFGIMITGFCMTTFAGLMWNTSLEDRWFQRLVAEVETRESMQKRLATMMDSMPGGVLFLTREGSIQDANVGVATMFGYTQPDFIGLNIAQLLPEEHRERFWSVLDRAITNKKMKHFRRRTFRIHALNHNGKAFVVLASIWAIEVDGIVGFGAFVSHGEAIEQQFEALRREMRIDHLTSTANKSSLDARLEQLQAHGSRSGEQVAIIMIDIDHFKVVNDSFGHPVGDAILSEFARRVSDSLRYSDSLYRYGGEEFTVLVIGASESALYELAERIRGRIENLAFTCDDERIAVTCSLGVAINDGRELLVDTLTRADKCLYKAKELGRNTTVMG
jgi:diguanylate cyclase (GGDEF)-like protein/PAS domain S-box-containing protein